jgi:hypothetical protein
MAKKQQGNKKPTSEIERQLEIVLGLCRETIPPVFYRTFEDKPFDVCIFCHRPLLIDGSRYLIMKYYAGGELIQEMAVCHQCSSELRFGYSDESKQALKAIYDNAYVQRRLSILLQAKENDDRVALMTNQCSICQISKENLEEYFRYAYCENNEIVFYTHPSMACHKCTLLIYLSLEM